MMLQQSSSSMHSSYFSTTSSQQKLPHNRSLLSFDDDDINNNNAANIFTFSPSSKSQNNLNNQHQPFPFTEAPSFDSKGKFDGIFSTRNSADFTRGLTPIANVIKDPWLSSRNNSEDNGCDDDDDHFNIMNPFNGHDLKSIFSPTAAVDIDNKQHHGIITDDSMINNDNDDNIITTTTTNNARKIPRLCISHVTIGTSSKEGSEESKNDMQESSSKTFTQVIISPINATNNNKNSNNYHTSSNIHRSRSSSIDQHVTTNQKSPLLKIQQHHELSDSITQISVSDIECNSNTNTKTTSTLNNTIVLNRTFSTSSTASSNNHNTNIADNTDATTTTVAKKSTPPPIISDSRDSTSTIASSINHNSNDTDMLLFGSTITSPTKSNNTDDSKKLSTSAINNVLPKLELSSSFDNPYVNNSLAISTTNSEASAERFWATCSSGISFDFSPTNHTATATNGTNVTTPIVRKKNNITSISPHSNDDFYDTAIKPTSSFTLNF